MRRKSIPEVMRRIGVKQLKAQQEGTTMFGKYTASQLAKSTAALLSALATFLGSVALIVTGIVPDGWGYALAGASAVIVRYATYLTNAQPTIEQIEAHADEVIDLVKKVRPSSMPES